MLGKSKNLDPAKQNNKFTATIKDKKALNPNLVKKPLAKCNSLFI